MIVSFKASQRIINHLVLEEMDRRSHRVSRLLLTPYFDQPVPGIWITGMAWEFWLPTFRDLFIYGPDSLGDSLDGVLRSLDAETEGYCSLTRDLLAGDA